MLPHELYTKKQAVTLNDILEGRSAARWNFFTGAVRSGKTYLTYLLLPHRIAQLPKGDCMMIGRTLGTLERNVLNPLREMYGAGVITQIYGTITKKVDIFGRTFYVMGADNIRSIPKIQGIGLVYCLGDEVATWTKGVFDMLKSRLSDSNAVFDGTCNPEGPFHWLKQFLDTPGLSLNHVHFHIDDNTFLNPEFVKALKLEYTGVFYDRFIRGLWVLAEGVIYGMIRSKVHIVKDLPAMVRHWVGVDYGSSNATAFLLIGQGVDNNFYIIKEYYYAAGEGQYSGKTDLEYANDFIEWLGNIVPEWIFIDPSAKSFRLQLWDLQSKCPALVNIAKADNDVLDGIRVTASMFGAERLFIHESCVNVIKESGSYCWDPKAQERGEDKPLKLNDHTMDALRYACIGISQGGFLQLAA